MKKKAEEHPSFPYPKTKDEIPATIKTAMLRKDRLVYQCPDQCWSTHFPAWIRTIREVNTAPEPIPFNHIVFNE